MIADRLYRLSHTLSTRLCRAGWVLGFKGHRKCLCHRTRVRQLSHRVWDGPPGIWSGEHALRPG